GPQGVAPPSAHSPVVGQARGRAAEASRGEDGRRTARAGDGFFMGADGGEEVHPPGALAADPSLGNRGTYVQPCPGRPATARTRLEGPRRPKRPPTPSSARRGPGRASRARRRPRG